jgi:ribosomal protein L11 methyltransferase
MRWAELTLHVPPDSTEPVSAVLTEAGCAGVAVVDPNAVSSDPFALQAGADEARPRPGAPCRVTAYLPVDDRLEASLDAVRAGLDAVRDAGFAVKDEITLRTVDDDSWADAWKAYFKPLRVGRRFVVKPSWETWDAAPDDLIIEIDPGMAFGSGSHPSTRLCLELLEETVRRGERVLDWGTGSGILGVGAVLLGAREVVAVDLDPVAVRAAEENAERNGFADRIRTSVASIEAVPADAPFDRVVANIVADPIIAGAGEIAARLRPGGPALVAGIIDRRETEVVRALEAAGLCLLRTAAEEEWRGLLFELPSRR